MKVLSKILAVLGVLVVAVAIVGRFVDAPTVLGRFVHPGFSAQAVLIGANTLLLLAILAHCLAGQDSRCGGSSDSAPKA